MSPDVIQFILVACCLSLPVRMQLQQGISSVFCCLSVSAGEQSENNHKIKIRVKSGVLMAGDFTDGFRPQLPAGVDSYQPSSPSESK